METKEQLIQKVKEWIFFEQQIKEHRKQIKEIQNKQKMVSSDLIQVMKENEIGSLDTQNCKILYTQHKSKTTINKKYLEQILHKYFQSEAKAIEMTEFILENREIKIKDGLRSKIT